MGALTARPRQFSELSILLSGDDYDTARKCVD